MPTNISRAAYADMFGPTTGDRVRLADTDLIIEVEKDLTTYGEEVKFGGGKVIRDGMGQSQVTRADGAVDTVITNALIVDHTGVYKADVGLKDGKIEKIGKAGNPDTQPGVDALPLQERAKFIGTESIACNIRLMCHGPGVQVVASVPCAGPVPPPSIVVRPECNASSICCGQIQCI